MSAADEIAWDYCFWNPELRCVYVWIPKTASTSIKRWLVGSTDRWGPLQDRVHVQLSAATLDKVSRTEALEILFDREAYKFAIVRNPYTRLVSAYLSILVSGSESVEALVRHHSFRSFSGACRWSWTRFVHGKEAARQLGLTFRELIDQIEQEDPATLDPHFRRQSLLMQGVPIDFIGRQEDLHVDFPHVQKRLGRNDELEVKFRQEYEQPEEADHVADWPAARFRETKPFPHWRRFYPLDLARRVAAYYRDDFARLGYSAAIPAIPSTNQESVTRRAA